MEALEPVSLLFSAPVRELLDFSEVGGGVMRIAQARFGRELLMVQDGSVAVSATLPALRSAAWGWGHAVSRLYSEK